MSGGTKNETQDIVTNLSLNKSPLKKHHHDHTKLHNLWLWLDTSKMPWSQKRALVQRFLSVCESWGSVATWALSVCLKIPCLVTVHIVSTCHRVNPHGRGQVDGEDERSEGARQVHLKTISWVVAWNMILIFVVVVVVNVQFPPQNYL